MKIEVKAEELFTTLGDLKRIVGALDGDTVTIEAKNGESGDSVVTARCLYKCEAELKIASKVVERGVMSVNIRELKQACSAFLRKTITVSSDGLYAFVECGCSRVRFETCGNLPPIGKPPEKADRAVFDTGDFLAVMAEVVHAQSDDPTRCVLRGVNFEVGTDMKLRAIASDGRRLAVCARQICRAELPSASFEVFLPRAAVEFAARAFHGETITVYKYGKPTAPTVAVETSGSLGAFGVPDLPFPAWRQCVPKNPPLRATFNGGELADAMCRSVGVLNRVETDKDEFGEEETYEVTLSARIASSGMTGTADIKVSEAWGGDTPSFFATVSCSTPDAAKFETLVNAQMLLEAVRAHEGAVEIYAHPIGESCAQLGPLLLKFPDEPDYFEIVMPMRES